MSGVTALGLLAGFCTTVAFLPQVIKTWRTRSTGDLSLGMFALFLTGVALWLAYGMFLGDVAIIAANAITFCLAAVILWFKLRER